MDCLTPLVIATLMLIVGWAIVAYTFASIRGPGAGVQLAVWAAAALGMLCLTIVYVVSLYKGAC